MSLTNQSCCLKETKKKPQQQLEAAARDAFDVALMSGWLLCDEILSGIKLKTFSFNVDLLQLIQTGLLAGGKQR